VAGVGAEIEFPVGLDRDMHVLIRHARIDRGKAVHRLDRFQGDADRGKRRTGDDHLAVAFQIGGIGRCRVLGDLRTLQFGLGVATGADDADGGFRQAKFVKRRDGFVGGLRVRIEPGNDGGHVSSSAA
jgi:hypothetical protein